MSMKKVWIVAVFALAAVSCVRMEDISCDGVESVEVRSLGASRSLVEVSVRASNASGAAVSIVRADLTLDRGETTLLRASVDEKVRLPRRSEEATVPHQNRSFRKDGEKGSGLPPCRAFAR